MTPTSLSAPFAARRFFSPEATAGTTGVPKHQIRVPLFKAGDRVAPNHVVFVENRPVRPWVYHDMIADAYSALQQLEGGTIPSDLPAEFIKDDRLRHMVEDSIRQGKLKDTTKIAGWLDKMNTTPSRFGELGIPTLDLVLAHAESPVSPDAPDRRIIDELTATIMGGNHPAAVIFSGSPKMLSECHATDPAVAKAIELARYCLTSNIPMLGICFGMHLLAFARYGEKALVQWLTTPAGMSLKVFPAGDGNKIELEPATPGQKQMVYGTSRIKRRSAMSNHPMLKFTDRVEGFEVHSQFLSPDQVPADVVMATSSQRFRESRMTRSRDELIRDMVEVLQCGAVAYATQGHPELTAELLLAITYMPKYEAVLRAEGHNLERVRAQFKRQLGSGTKWGVGERYGYNFIKYIVLANYVKKLLADEPAGTARFWHLAWLMSELRRLAPGLDRVLI